MRLVVGRREVRLLSEGPVVGVAKAALILGPFFCVRVASQR